MIFIIIKNGEKNTIFKKVLLKIVSSTFETYLYLTTLVYNFFFKNNNMESSTYKEVDFFDLLLKLCIFS